MSAIDYMSRGWSANPVVIVAAAVAVLGYVRLFGRRGRPAFFAAAVAVAVVSLLSPLNLLANGVLFSAHMTQHILLLLFVPGLFLLGLPGEPRPVAIAAAPARADMPRPNMPLTVICWALGVGSMWFWHVPQLCNAAATVPPVHAVQTLSLLVMGTAFWWPILGPRRAHRLVPGHGVAYLFTACLACTGLGVLLTLTPVEVCSAFSAPSTAPAPWGALRDQLGARRDQQVGGLLMWLPMCLVYVAGIVLELARWLGEPGNTPLRAAPPPPRA